ncbi:bromodomain-containing factor 1 [Enteropsectra breve]|nr:bromodomain-containing factor 1 [Enteropsectra breve]
MDEESEQNKTHSEHQYDESQLKYDEFQIPHDESQADNERSDFNSIFLASRETSFSKDPNDTHREATNNSDNQYDNSDNHIVNSDTQYINSDNQFNNQFNNSDNQFNNQFNNSDNVTAESEQLRAVQLKYCLSIIQRMKRSSNITPFLHPVDPVALNIPDYFEKIQNPMDISTVKRKLDSGEYRTPGEFNADMALMFSNCFTYNSPGNPVHEMGKTLQRLYTSLYSSLPVKLAPVKLVPEKKSVSDKKPGSETKKPVSEEKKRAPSNSSDANDGALKVKRQAKTGESFSADDYLFCSNILTELEKPKYKKFAWPFIHPVKEEDAPNYFAIIHSPMDLDTMRNKLDFKKYGAVQGFISDLELIAENCRKYNAPGTAVYECGEEFERTYKALVHGRRGGEGRIAEVRRRLQSLTTELVELERRLAATQRIFSISDRERLAKDIMHLGRTQSERVAEIVQRACCYDYIDNDEVEVNLQTIPDAVADEIYRYIERVKNYEDVNSSE